MNTTQGIVAIIILLSLSVGVGAATERVHQSASVSSLDYTAESTVECGETNAERDSFVIESVNVTNVSVDDQFRFEANVTNPNTFRATQTIELRFKNSLVQRKCVTISGASTKTVTFTGRLSPSLIERYNITEPSWQDFNFLTVAQGQRKWVFVSFSPEELNDTGERVSESFTVSELAISWSQAPNGVIVSVIGPSKVNIINFGLPTDVISNRISFLRESKTNVKFEITLDPGSVVVKILSTNEGIRILVNQSSL